MSSSTGDNQLIVLARPIGGTTLNGLEFLLDKENDYDYRKFESKEAARAFIRAEIFPDSTDAEQDDYYTFMTVEEAHAYEAKAKENAN